MIIEKYEDLEKLTELAATGELITDEILFSEDLSFVLKLKGEKWDGLVDQDVAKFVLQLQDTINDLYKRLAFDDPRYKRVPKSIAEDIKVKVKVEFGCSLFDIKIGNAFKAVFANMTGRQKVALYSAVTLIICGSLVGVSLIETESKIEEIKASHEHDMEILKLLDKAMDRIPDAYRPIDTLTKSMNDEDTIEFSTGNVDFSKYEIRQKVEPQNASDGVTTSHYVDDLYEIDRIYKDSDEISISINGFRFQASTLPLQDKDKSAIHDVFKRGHLNKAPALINIQLAVVIKGTQIHEALVVGVGEKRPEAKPLSEIIAISIETEPDELPLLKLTQSPK